MIQQARYIKESLNQVPEAAILDVQGLASLAFDITETFVGTASFEYTINGTDWYALTANIVGSSTTATSATAVGKWTANVAGFLKVRIRCSAYTSGTMVVSMRAVMSGGGASAGSGGDVQTAGADAASNTANAQTTNSRISGFNGTTWDRIKAGITTVTATLTGFLNTLPWAIYHATPATRTEAQGGPLEADNTGALINNPKPLKKIIDSIEARPEGTTYINMTASTLVRTGTGILVGMYVNSTSSGTIKFWDNTSAATTVINNTITPAIGWHNLGNATFATGLYATIGSTLDVTLYYIPTP